MRIFLAGIMQGSQSDATLHDQDYRGLLAAILREAWPGCEIYDPWNDPDNTFEFDESQSREIFLQHNRRCREADAVIAYLPHASMGTAIEMWEAFRHGRAVLVISPLARNWTVRLCSHAVYPSLKAFAQALANGDAARTIERVLAAAPASGEPFDS